MKKAFTLIELLVVIAIIGILAGVLITSFGSGTETARAAKCLSNMRNIAQVTIAIAAKGDKGFGDWFPLAGSRAVMRAGNDNVEYLEDRGWISWLSKNDEYGMRARGGKHPSSFVGLSSASAYSKGDSQEDQIFAITNGAIWAAMNGNRETYVCPDHVRAAKKKGVTVNWSYVMSAYFGYDWSDGQKAVDAVDVDTKDRVSLNSSRLDRTLLFAELPFNDHEFGGRSVSAPFDVGANSANDGILQYKASYNGRNYNQKWSGTAETIAFNHRSGKRWCAHVAFADGHTEKLLLPSGSGGLNREQLTALLCGHDGTDNDPRTGGEDISFNGKTYELLKDK